MTGNSDLSNLIFAGRSSLEPELVWILVSSAVCSVANALFLVVTNRRRPARPISRTHTNNTVATTIVQCSTLRAILHSEHGLRIRDNAASNLQLSVLVSLAEQCSGLESESRNFDTSG